MLSLNSPLRISYLFLLIPFSVFAEINYEPNNSLDDAKPIHVDDFSQKHKFDYLGDEDWLVFYAKKRTTYDIKIESINVTEEINPAFTIYDENGEIEVNLRDIDLSGEGIELLSWEAPTDAFYYIKVSNEGSGFSQAGHYSVEIFVANAPLRGLVRGKIIDQCTKKGLGDVEISATEETINLLVDQKLSFKTGEYSIPLNPGSYRITTRLHGYQDKVITIRVEENSNPSLQFEILPDGGCPSISTDESVDPNDLSQRAVGVFDESSGLLTLKEVRVGDKIFTARLQKQENFTFKLLSAIEINNSVTKRPAFYNYDSSLVEIPMVFTFNQLYRVKLKKISSDGVYGIEKADPLSLLQNSKFHEPILANESYLHF